MADEVLFQVEHEMNSQQGSSTCGWSAVASITCSICRSKSCNIMLHQHCRLCCIPACQGWRLTWTAHTYKTTGHHPCECHVMQGCSLQPVPIIVRLPCKHGVWTGTKSTTTVYSRAAAAQISFQVLQDNKLWLVPRGKFMQVGVHAFLDLLRLYISGLPVTAE